jgi:glycosyltransferase involved in cell wall biosynthesis
MPLLVVGDGPMAAEVRDWGARRGNVRCVGLRSNAECRELMARASVVIAPSRARETFGLVLVEAMAAGVPAVAAGHGGFVDIVDHGVTGLLHRPDDAESLAECIDRILGDEGYGITLGRRARARYEERFSPAAGLAALESAYAEVVVGHAAAVTARRPGMHQNQT